MILYLVSPLAKKADKIADWGFAGIQEKILELNKQSRLVSLQFGFIGGQRVHIKSDL